MSLKGEVPQRRRGAALETALLDAAWAELAERGYDDLTIDAVATRAGTSRAVLYRRWPGKHELMLAALVHQARAEPVAIPDTGSLRGDVIAVMHEANKVRPRLVAQLLTRLGGFYADASTNLAELSAYVLGGRNAVTDELIGRAVERGEVEPGQISGRVARLPIDLFRHELLMTLQPVADEVIEEIVDGIFLPLVRLGADDQRPT
ncbi:TetR/AcrR family transcriptional regulator [Candidatus Mycobacterium wuenschmannii]|uniref:TetR/AcrR family transcriptional regulator n=1 Tax=Candidatus Mycobacterium wuenschmannii TaxID=3027808 RepID=A0ABY8W045_9MYCO|nr:TetR/AcrR family transcriptional regulator [Candidatus Mycobacterium wuenschmannii]WIM88506.1 TetR/AcrR family transcriptional regulator [Candidatus Mycobacterium wuenschmannii]